MSSASRPKPYIVVWDERSRVSRPLEPYIKIDRCLVNAIITYLAVLAGIGAAFYLYHKGDAQLAKFWFMEYFTYIKFLPLYPAYLAFMSAYKPIPVWQQHSGPRIYEKEEAEDFISEIITQRIEFEENIKPAKRLTYRKANALQKYTGRVYYLTENVPILERNFSTHAVIVGMTGSGKTVTIYFLLKQIFRKKQRCIIFDPKGDFIGYFTDDVSIIINPFDARSYYMNLAKLFNQFTIRTFFEDMLNPEGKKGEFFLNEPINFCVAVFKYFYITYKEFYFEDALDVLVGDVDTLRMIFTEIAPELLPNFESEKQLSGVRSAVSSSIGALREMLDIWSLRRYREFDLRQYLLNKSYPIRRIIVKWSGENEAISKLLFSTIFNYISRMTTGDELENSKIKTWIVFDEFITAGKIKFEDIIDKGRSRGFMLVLGYQNNQQVKMVYAEEQLKSLISQVGLLILTGTQTSDDTTYICKELIGEGVYVRQNPSLESENGKSYIKYVPTTETRLVITPDQLASKLGTKDKGVRFLVRGIKESDAQNSSWFILDKQFNDEPAVKRPQFIPAKIDKIDSFNKRKQKADDLKEKLLRAKLQAQDVEFSEKGFNLDDYTMADFDDADEQDYLQCNE